MNAGTGLRPFIFLATRTETVGDFTVTFGTKKYFKLVQFIDVYKQVICLGKHARKSA
jgi:hypothetical protein